MKGDKLKRSKRVAVSVHDQPEVQPSKSVSSKCDVSDKVCFVKSQHSAVKSADQRLHRRRSSVSVESESESDEKHNDDCRRHVLSLIHI